MALDARYSAEPDCAELSENTMVFAPKYSKPAFMASPPPSPLTTLLPVTLTPSLMARDVLSLMAKAPPRLPALLKDRESGTAASRTLLVREYTALHGRAYGSESERSDVESKVTEAAHRQRTRLAFRRCCG